MLNDTEVSQYIESLQDPNIDVGEKNRIALLLVDSEVRDERLFKVLTDLILDKKYVNHRGTFVHCLSFFPPEKSFSLAMDLIIYGNLEVAHEAFLIIESIEHISGDEVRAAYSKLVDFYENGHFDYEWRKELVEEAIEMFD